MGLYRGSNFYILPGVWDVNNAREIKRNTGSVKGAGVLGQDSVVDLKSFGAYL